MLFKTHKSSKFKHTILNDTLFAFKITLSSSISCYITNLINKKSPVSLLFFYFLLSPKHETEPSYFKSFTLVRVEICYLLLHILLPFTLTCSPLSLCSSCVTLNGVSWWRKHLHKQQFWSEISFFFSVCSPHPLLSHFAALCRVNHPAPTPNLTMVSVIFDQHPTRNIVISICPFTSFISESCHVCHSVCRGQKKGRHPRCWRCYRRNRGRAARLSVKLTFPFA